MRERCLAESRMIKSKIIYKVNHDMPLSKPERKYLKSWKTAMRKTKTIIDDCMVPSVPSGMKIGDLSDNDLA